MTALAPVIERPRWTRAVTPRLLVCAALAAALALLAFAIVFLFKIGPVVVVIDPHAGRGIHVGDLWAVPSASASLLFTLLGLPARA